MNPPGVVAVVPARGGSKGVPGKNLRRVGGRTLVARAVDACRAASAVDLVVVTTDHDGIADEARSAGAVVVRRPESLSGDTASSESAVLHALDELERTEVVDHPQVVVLVQCTSPFIAPVDIDRCVDLVLAGDADVAFTATPFHGFTWRPTPSGVVGVNHDSTGRPRRQERAEEHLESGGAYAMRTEGLRAGGHRFFGRVTSVLVPPMSAFEVDDEGDLAVVQAVAPLLPADRRSLSPESIDAIALDFDGVMTDNTVVVTQGGEESVVCHRGDGWGVSLLRAAGYRLVVLSTEQNPVTSVRCRKLGLEVVQGLESKVGSLRSWMERNELDARRVAFVGNDTNDLGCMHEVGWPIAVADAAPEAQSAARVVLSARGGEGAIREVARLLCDPPAPG